MNNLAFQDKVPQLISLIMETCIPIPTRESGDVSIKDGLVMVQIIKPQPFDEKRLINHIRVDMTYMDIAVNTTLLTWHRAEILEILDLAPEIFKANTSFHQIAEVLQENSSYALGLIAMGYVLGLWDFVKQPEDEETDEYASDRAKEIVEMVKQQLSPDNTMLMHINILITDYNRNGEPRLDQPTAISDKFTSSNSRIQ